MKYLMTFCLCLSIITFANTQNTITGVVKNDTGELLFGATIKWEGTSNGTVTDIDGSFELIRIENGTQLEIDYVGYSTVRIPVYPEEEVLNIEINGITELMAVEVAAKIRDSYVSTLDPINVESITTKELRKAACCSLSEAFETNAAVDVAQSDAVTGAKEIQMLGLRGLYTQMLMEARPSMGGLGVAYALDYIPGTWLQGIQISKGTSTVRNGFQSITGQINAELHKPFRDHSVFLNVYGSTMGRGEVNLHLNKKINDIWSSGVLLHASKTSNSFDHDQDGFLDASQKEMLNGMYRLFYRGNDLRFQFNVHALSDKRESGQVIPEGNQPNGYYRILQEAKRLEFFGKMGYIGFDNPNKSIAVIANAAMHETNSYYGDVYHIGQQKSLYTNFIYATSLNDSKHSFNTGATFQLDDFDEQLDDIDLSRQEVVPGAFFEYTLNPTNEEKLPGEKYNWAEEIGLIAGLRVDHHNLHGLLITPRINTKINFNEDNSIVRLSAGRGFRTANVIAENLSQLISNRVIDIANDLKIEDAWNYGINYTQNFDISDKDASISLDLYRTQFTNQVVMDLESDYNSVQFYNLDGQSYSNSFLSTFNVDLSKNVGLKLAYKFNDVKITYKGDLREKPLVAKHRGLLALDFHTTDEKWQFNTHFQIVGKQRMPSTIGYPDEFLTYHPGNESPAYMVMNAQITRKFKNNLELYLGGENLTNYRQSHPIIAFQDTDSPFFNASQVYGPTQGRRAYFGLRWFFDEGQKEAKFPTMRISTSGKCEMCTETIEKGLSKVKGVKEVNFDLESNVVSVKYDITKVNDSEIRLALNMLGYSADGLPADQAAYEALPGCCQ